ncbi:MAG: aminotransferase class I/II-fold pyridoxal phosphate-dependent enzyme [Gemmatimonadetes bacterium]|nr:aminotransferase class I/II-fold pyridoxal phosphate-dependent enzyme [Gemmatimonadota bacterium]
MTPTPSGPSPANPLELDPETMRRLGHLVVDLLVARIASLDADAAWRGATRAELEPRLREPPPERPGDFERLLDRVVREVLEYAGRIDHPRFLAFIPSCPTWPGILGDLLASGFNVFQGTWLESSGPSQLELVVLDWFKDWLGYPPEAAGLLVSGASAANLIALVCAREALLGGPSADAVIYYSTETHSSVERAARIAGFTPDQIRTLPADGSFRLPLDALRRAVDDDARAGRRPFLIVANAGATSTGAIDPFTALADFCAERRLWLHADAAYGGFAVLTERGRAWLDGIGRADSITLDPHKWLYQPYEVGCLLVRGGARLRDAFHIMPDYLQDTAVGGGEVNFADRGLQLTRAARVLKIWLSLQAFGVAAFRRAIDRALDLTLEAQRRIERAAAFELLAPAALGVVCFRRRVPGGDEPAHERANAALVQGLNRSGLGMISSTRVRGRYALRLCIMNHRTTLGDVERVIHWLESEPLSG